jgi:hypothetical protein
MVARPGGIGRVATQHGGIGMDNAQLFGVGRVGQVGGRVRGFGGGSPHEDGGRGIGRWRERQDGIGAKVWRTRILTATVRLRRDGGGGAAREVAGFDQCLGWLVMLGDLPTFPCERRPSITTLAALRPHVILQPGCPIGPSPYNRRLEVVPSTALRLPGPLPPSHGSSRASGG